MMRLLIWLVGFNPSFLPLPSAVYLCSTFNSPLYCFNPKFPWKNEQKIKWKEKICCSQPWFSVFEKLHSFRGRCCSLKVAFDFPALCLCLEILSCKTVLTDLEVDYGKFDPRARVLFRLEVTLLFFFLDYSLMLQLKPVSEIITCFISAIQKVVLKYINLKHKLFRLCLTCFWTKYTDTLITFMYGTLTKYILGYPQNGEVCFPVESWSVKMRLFFVYSLTATIFQNSDRSLKSLWKNRQIILFKNCNFIHNWLTGAEPGNTVVQLWIKNAVLFL